MNMKHSTKFIIQENRLEKLVSKYLNEFGLSKTSQMMGVSRSKVLELAKIPIDSLYAYEILYEKMSRNELKNIYEGFEIRTSLDGVFYWESMMVPETEKLILKTWPPVRRDVPILFVIS